MITTLQDIFRLELKKPLRPTNCNKEAAWLIMINIYGHLHEIFKQVRFFSVFGLLMCTY